MDIVDGNIIRSTDGKVLMSLKELAMTAQYNAAKSERITAECAKVYARLSHEGTYTEIALK